MASLETRLHRLRELWPDLEWDDARIEWCDHDVVLLDDKWVFRFAAKDPRHEPLQLEIAVLERIRDRIDLPIPDYQRIAPGFEVAGYPFLKGSPATEEAWEELPESAHNKAAEDLAQMLNIIHSWSIPAFLTATPNE